MYCHQAGTAALLQKIGHGRGNGRDRESAALSQKGPAGCGTPGLTQGEKIFSMKRTPQHQTPDVSQPGTEAFDLAASPLESARSATLTLRWRATSAMRRDAPDDILFMQPMIQSITGVSVLHDQSNWNSVGLLLGNPFLC